MAGKIIADTLEHSTAGSLTTDYVVNGSAKAWMNLTGTGTIAVNDSLNVTSCTDAGTGRYKPQFTNSFNTTRYTPQCIDDNYGIGWVNGYATGECQNVRANNTFTLNDPTTVSFSAHGDLA